MPWSSDRIETEAGSKPGSTYGWDQKTGADAGFMSGSADPFAALQSLVKLLDDAVARQTAREAMNLRPGL